MKIHVLPSGPIQTIGYLLMEPARGEAVLVDAPGGILAKIQPLLAKEGCTLKELWLTHGHWDHMQGAAEIVRATGAKTRAHVADQMLYESPQIMEERMGRQLGLEAVKIDHWVVQSERLKALGLEVEVRHVPGHCPGNVLFYFASAHAAFVGDALFNGSIGRTDLPGGNFEELEQSIRTQIYSLPGATKVYPGHGPATTVAHEKANNPHVSG